MMAGTLSLSAQDIHFSQFYMSPLNLNPALTGVMNCNVRLAANYRNQWASVLKDNAYNTYSVSYDQKIAVGRYDNFGVGATFWGDKAGEANFATTTGKISLSYAKRMGGGRGSSHYLVFGAEGGLAQRSLDFLKLRWGSQIQAGIASGDTSNGGVGENPGPSNELGLNDDNFIFGDVGAGLLWFSVFDENNNLYVGGAFHHLNQANQSFFLANPPAAGQPVTDDTRAEEFLFSRWTAHAGGEFEVTNKIGLVPGIIFMKQGPSVQINSGTSLKFKLGSGSSRTQQAFHIGAWVRISNQVESGVLTDAAILSTRFDYNQFSIGFSYDINVSALRPASNGNGSFEFAMIYKFCNLQKRGVYCPNF